MQRPIGQETARLRERVTLGLRDSNCWPPLHDSLSGVTALILFLQLVNQMETQVIAFQPLPVSVSGLIPSQYAAPVPCWSGKFQHQVIKTQTVPEYPFQFGCQALALQDPPRISPHTIAVSIEYKCNK